MSSFGLEFPYSSSVKDDLLRTFRRLGLVEPDDWRNTALENIMEAMQRSMYASGQPQPSQVLVNPKAWASLQEQLKSRK